MHFLKRLLVGIASEIRAIVRVLVLLRWQCWVAWALLLLVAFLGVWPSAWLLAVQCVLPIAFGLMAILSGRVAAAVRRRNWVRLPDDHGVAPFLPQLILLAAFPPFFLAMTVLFWKAAQVAPGTLPVQGWADAFVLATNNFVRCQFFFDAAEIFHFWIGGTEKPGGFFGPSLMLLCRVIMDVVFLKLAFQVVLAAYYRARGFGGSADVLLLLREALQVGDTPRIRQLSESVRNSLEHAVESTLNHLNSTSTGSSAKQRAWHSLRAMKEFALPYLGDRQQQASIDEARRLDAIIQELRDADAITHWRQIEHTYEVRRWPLLPLAAIWVAGLALPLLLSTPAWCLTAAGAMVLFATWMLLDARRWLNKLLLRWRVIRPYGPSALPGLLTRWSLAIAPLLIVSVAAMFYHLETLSPHETFVASERSSLDDGLGWGSSFAYVLANLLRTNIFLDVLEVYELDPAPVVTFDAVGCTITLFTRMIFDLGFISLWASVLTLRFNRIFRAAKVRPHVNLKIQIEARENEQRSSRFVLYYYRHIRSFLLHAMRDSLDDRQILAALGYSGFLPVLKQEVDRERRGAEVNAVHRANLGFALTMQSRTEEAIEEERLAIRVLQRLDSEGHPHAAEELAGAKLDLAVAREREGHWEAAIALYGDAIASFEELAHTRGKDVQTDWAFALNRLAWLLATCPESSCRDGARAVELAEQSCELTRYTDVDYIDTLAAAYAETGAFEQAIAFQQKVCENPKHDAEEQEFALRLRHYEQNVPFHQQARQA